MTRPRLIRGLRIAWSVAWGILCVLLVVLWVRSYSWVDTAGGPIYADYEFGVSSLFGTVGISVAKNNSAWGLITQPMDELWGNSSRIWGKFICKSDTIAAPHWCLILLSGTLASAPWVRSRFSLRSLLIATTLIAVVLGLAVWSAR
jgi:hypothetical protein